MQQQQVKQKTEKKLLNKKKNKKQEKQIGLSVTIEHEKTQSKTKNVS